MSRKFKDLDGFLRLLKGVKLGSNGQHIALCPGHNDIEPSLSIKEVNGTIILHCFAGCSLAQILAALNLTTADLFLNDREPNRPRQERGEIKAVYQYTGSNGEPFEVVRFKPKGFAQRRPDSKGGYIWNVRGITPTLYRGEEVKQAIEAGEPILIPEGEKDVENVRTLGFTATTNLGGAGKWKDRYSRELAGADCIIIVDKDAAGRSHAENIAKSVYGRALRVRVLELPGNVKDLSDWVNVGGTTEELEQLVSEVSEWKPEAGLELPQIMVTERHLRDMTEEALIALHASNSPPHIFLRGSRMVRIVTDEDGKPIINTLNESELRYELAKAINFMRLKHGGQEVPTAPPVAVARNVMAEPNPGFPPLLNITEAPVIRSDGSILLNPGYDPITKLYYFPAPGLVVPPILDRPSQDDIRHTVLTLDEVIHDFPFDSPSSYANALAMMISPVARAMISGCTPLGVITKPQVGTGASLLAETTAIISTGRSAAMMSAPRDDEAWRKGLTGLLLRGQAVVVIDNVEGTLYSAALAALLTADTYQDRVLGSNDMVILPNKITLIATGNNIRLGGDLPRRCVVSRMDSSEARPWLRDSSKFRHPFLKEWVLANRGTILVAILTLIRAWVLAGRPQAPDIPNLGGYENWVRTIGGILHFAGIPGFLGNLDYVYDTADTETPQWEAFLTAWYDRLGEKAVTASDISKQLQEHEDFCDVLPDALIDTRREAKGFTRRLGNALATRAGRRYPNGLQLLRSEKTRDRAVLWQVRMSFNGGNSAGLASKLSLDEFGSGQRRSDSDNNNPKVSSGSTGLIETHSEAKNPEFSGQRSPQLEDEYPDYPAGPCPICGCSDYWLTGWNQWLCSRCHPRPE